MKDTKIIFRCIEKSKMRETEVDRQDMLTVFDGLMKGFGDDNEVSTKLVSIIPEVDAIMINKDRNTSLDIPIIIAIFFNEDGTVKDRQIINVRRRHTIVWSILNKYCG